MSMQYLEAVAPMAGGESNPTSRPQSYYAPIPEDRELVLQDRDQAPARAGQGIQ